MVGAGAGVGFADGCCAAVTRTATTGAGWITTGAAATGAVVAGAAAGCGAGVTGCGAGAGFGATGVDGATCGMTTGFGFATGCSCGCRRGVGTVRNVTVGATVSRGDSAAAEGSVAAWMSAGWVPAGRAEKDGVSLPDGPARRRGSAAAAATAPASKIAATIRSIELMFPTPDADSITRTRYRQHGARA